MPDYPLAKRRDRVIAFIIDQFLMAFLALPILMLFGFTPSVVNGEVAAVSPEYSQLIFIQAIAIVCYLILNGYLLLYYGQTIGKRIMGIAIATMEQELPSLNQSFVIRFLLFTLVGLLPLLGMIITLMDWLSITREDKRCLHDILAGTKVIHVGKIR